MNESYDGTESFYRLKVEAVRQEIDRQNLKRWWVAEFAGVHKTTLRRWLSGEIRKVRMNRIERLAGVLATRPQAIAAPWEEEKPPATRVLTKRAPEVT